MYFRNVTTPTHDFIRNITLQYPSDDKAEWTSFIAQLNELRKNRSYTKKYNFSQLRNTLNSEQCTKRLDKIVDTIKHKCSKETTKDFEYQCTFNPAYTPNDSLLYIDVDESLI